MRERTLYYFHLLVASKSKVESIIALRESNWFFYDNHVNQVACIVIKL